LIASNASLGEEVSGISFSISFTSLRVKLSLTFFIQGQANEDAIPQNPIPKNKSVIEVYSLSIVFLTQYSATSVRVLLARAYSLGDVTLI
jgi:hypothetical protein